MLGLIALVAIGFVRQLLRICSLGASISRVADYQMRFVDWIHEGANADLRYESLVRDSVTVQNLLGTNGRMSVRMPHESGYHTDFPIVLNGIPMILRENKNTSAIFRQSSIVGAWSRMVGDALTRYLGFSEDAHNQAIKKLLNPFVLLAHGVRTIMEIPLIILTESGILATNTHHKLAASWVFSLASGLLTIATLCFTLMNVVSGWHKFASQIGLTPTANEIAGLESEGN